MKKISYPLVVACILSSFCFEGHSVCSDSDSKRGDLFENIANGMNPVCAVQQYCGKMDHFTISGCSSQMPQSPTEAENTHDAKALRIECMDFRLVNKAEKYYETQGLKSQADLIVYAGASLAILDTESGSVPDGLSATGQSVLEYNAWEYFDLHLKLSVDLHHITDVYIMDHENCGVYGAVYGDRVDAKICGETKARHAERLLHIENLQKAKELILENFAKKYPKLVVHKQYIHLDGSVEEFD